MLPRPKNSKNRREDLPSPVRTTTRNLEDYNLPLHPLPIDKRKTENLSEESTPARPELMSLFEEKEQNLSEKSTSARPELVILSKKTCPPVMAWALPILSNVGVSCTGSGSLYNAYSFVVIWRNGTGHITQVAAQTPAIGSWSQAITPPIPSTSLLMGLTASREIEELVGQDHGEPHATEPPDKKDSSADPLPIALTVSKNPAVDEVHDDPLRRRRFEDFKGKRLSDAVIDRDPAVDKSPTDIPDPLDLQGRRSGDPLEKTKPPIRKKRQTDSILEILTVSKSPAADEVSGDPPNPHDRKPEDHGEERTVDPLDKKMFSADPTATTIQDHAFLSPLPPLSYY
ncbi:hypothetical protein E4U14_004332 [Claviceps sp. LM454 group G7]|nr:hypothetical protein E4U14_004332 [Claviceps sp. LM454 group G7]